MTPPHIKVYSADSSGLGYGAYEQIYVSGLKVNITHSMLQGDQMTFQCIDSSDNPGIDMKRPIRFYTGDDTKLFDGVITEVDYEQLGNNNVKLTGTASGWWQELKSMDLMHDIVYDNETPNFMFADLCRIANNFGIMKKAQYKYDTGYVPHYSTFSTAYSTATGAEFVVSNVFQGMMDILAYMDVAETSSPYDFGLRIESLPAAVGDTWELSESDVDTGIYVLPYVMREDDTAKETYKRFQLEAGFNIKKDYRNLCNSCVAVGYEHHTQQIRSTDILNGVSITSNDHSFPIDNQVFGDHYLAVTIDNPTGVDKPGYVQITRVSGATNPVETFPLTAPAGEVVTRYTSDRCADGLPGAGNFLRCVYFTGCVVKVEEVTNDASPYNTTVAGRSINDIGYAAKRLENMWVTTQARADALAGKMVRLYHNPMQHADTTILDKYVTFDNNLGKVVDIYSQYEVEDVPFILMSSHWEFMGESASQSITAQLHATNWDITELYEYVIDELGNYVVDEFDNRITAE